MIRNLGLSIGDIVAPQPRSSPLGEPCDPTWFILIARPQRDQALEAYLRLIGVLDVWRPTVPAWRKSKGPRGKVQYEHNVAPGYVFTLMDRHPQWHIIRHHAGARMRGVVGWDGIPRPISSETMAEMIMVPKRIEILRKDGEAARRAALASKAPRSGDKARVMFGDTSYVVDISEVDLGVAHFVINSLRCRVPVDQAERIEKS